MKIGEFILESKTGVYTGSIMTLMMQRDDVQLRPVQKTVEREPDYRAITMTADGAVEIGAAWKKAGREGRDYVSVMIDDPSFAAPLNAALFLDADGATGTLVWNRPKRKAKAA